MQFGELCVIRSGHLKGNHLHWQCVCGCGKSVTATSQNLRRGKTRSCGCLRRKMSRINNWEGYQDISRDYLSSLQRGAGIRNLIFTLTPKELWDLFEAQKRRCALTGELLIFSTRRASGQTASLDRKDPKVGYVSGNVQWVHKRVNFCKGALTNDDFINLCRAVAAKAV